MQAGENTHHRVIEIHMLFPWTLLFVCTLDGSLLIYPVRDPMPDAL